uniref:ATP synthase F0 subunit 8 n=1 Tax=Coelorinchus caelorhincus TaxID=630657 RepID=UPI0028D107E0|nr:ATP synthase F0 subunit 8 [Coelorinchus caelorhincus]WMY89529.1 ATP synthase F0 subunit 8 [Coelorinchus caelorhincus]
MPQLNPNPWFMILIYTWTIFLLVVLPMTLLFIMPNHPATQNMSTPKAKPWIWPWH